MAEKQKILIVDDDASISELISLYLEKEMFDTRCAADGEEALQLFPEYQPNLVILDLMLPGIDGYEVCRRLRASSQVPVIMLSAKGETFDKVLGLELGADDYMVKPFESKELVARVKAVLRRYQQAQAQVNAAVDAALSAQQAKAVPGLVTNAAGAAAAGFAMNGAAGAAAAGFAKNGGVGAASPQARMGAGFLDTTGLPAADAEGNITFRAYAEGDSGSGELYTYNGQTGQLHRGGTDARTHATDMLDAYRNGDYIEYKDLIVNKSNYAVYYSGHVVEMPPSFSTSWHPHRIRSSRESSSSITSGAMSSPEIPERSMCTSSGCARSCRGIRTGRSPRSGASATNSELSKKRRRGGSPGGVLYDSGSS